MQISELMTRDVRMIGPNDTIQRAAQVMAEIDAGVVLVSEGDKLVGMITDRDIAVRAIANGKGPQTDVREAMSENVKYCFEDDNVAEVSGNMSKIQVRRLPVLDRNKRLVGIVSLGDIAVAHASEASSALQGISEPGGPHSQTA